jgi:predicted short-subunit dehydrogenase-like oxidoreductase (DUF2520 family)
MKRKPSICIVGAGNLAKSLVPALRAAGYVIDEIISRNQPQSLARARSLARVAGARAAAMDRAKLLADVVWLCVNDGAIAACAAELAARTPAGRAARRRGKAWTGKTVLHSSGALSSRELAPLRRQGAEVASVHPMMTFVRRSSPSLRGIGFAIEGGRAAAAVASSIASTLGGEVFAIRESAKALYHAWGAFGSPLLVMDLALAAEVARAAGIGPRTAARVIEPLVRQTIKNYFKYGAKAAFSGPFVRGDLETVRRHLRALERVPGARDVYVALARSALRTLPVKRKSAIEATLAIINL